MITRNIIRFLETEESVIINKLGRFSKKVLPASVEGSMILPPKVILEFEYFEDGSGFPIVDKISKWEFLRLLDADDAVNKWVTELKVSVQNNKSVVFDNFGTFSLNEKQCINFTSAVIKELNTEYLGMDPVPLTKTGKTKKSTVPIVNPEEMHITESISEKIPEPVVEVTPEPVVEVTPEPVVEVTPEPVVKVTPEPVVEVTPEPVVEETTEPVVEVTPEPVVDEIPEQEEKIIQHKSFANEPRTSAVLSPEEKILTGMLDSKKLHNVVLQDEEEILKIEPANEEQYTEEEQTEENLEAPRKRKRSGIGTLLFIIVILGAVAVILLLFKDPIIEFYNSKFKETPVETPVVPVPQPSDNLEVDQLLNETDSISEPSNSSTEVDPTPVQPENSKPVQTQNASVKGSFPIVSMEKGKFYVIAGSFTKENDAITHIKDKKLGQYNPILITGQSRIRVCIGTFTTEAEALAFAKKVDNSYWVLK